MLIGLLVLLALLKFIFGEDCGPIEDVAAGILFIVAFAFVIFVIVLLTIK